ncbi:MAG: UvrD/REP helicase [Parcubacteria group bacterium GW2011_GWA2_49_9]|nr:MAG: UvrD/REP helicase [Parcubacteria group bacterium GW2011_GWA2_49_9]
MNSEKFQEEYKKLNAKQKEAVDAIDDPVMVIAGPGTGKTRILVLRIAKILLSGNGTPASGILCLTFTEAGADEMKRRLREIIGVTAEEIHVHTYHGFAGSIIAEFPEHFPHLSRTKQITEIEAETIVRMLLKEKKFSKLRPAGEPDFYVGKILNTIKEAKREAWTPKAMREFAKKESERIKNDESSLSSRGKTKGMLKGTALERIEKCERTILFSDVYEAYEAKKKEEKKMDFDDLISELLRAFLKDKTLLQILQERFLYILVDEHQDTNDSQNILIRTIADFYDSPNLFVVGDEKQAIFRFQGASVQNFLNFRSIWPKMKEVRLEENFRSHQDILDASFSMIENNYAEGEHKNLRVKLLAKGNEKQRPIDVVTAGNTEASDKYLVEKLREIVVGHPKETVAIILRKNKDVEHILSLLGANGISAQAERGVDMFSHPLGLLYFDLIDYLSHPEKVEALAKTIAGGLWNLSFAQKTLLIRAIRSGNVRDITEESTNIGKLQRDITKAGAITFLVLAGKLSGLDNIAARNPLSAEVWRSIISLAQDLAEQSEIQSPTELIEVLLAHRKSAEKKSLKISIGQPDSRIHVMTAHGSKGLEYDYVFLPYATKEAWLSHRRGTSFVLPREKGDEDEIRDARRLFYVALTRARKHVTILVGLKDNVKKEFSPLRFIEELNAESVAHIDVPAVYENVSAKIAGDSEKAQETEILNYTKSLLLKSGLSVTALNHFVECPSRFFYKSILKLPEAPNPNSEKGNAMHEALSYVWRLESKSEEAIIKNIESSVKAYFNRSLLPLSEKEVAVEELCVNAPKVARALLPLFSIQGKVATEISIKTVYTGRYEKHDIVLPLHGTLDAVVDGEGKTLVFDYKTKEAMSVNAIKGETKNDDGNYFRQLVFYKILLEGAPGYKNKVIEPALVFIKPDSKGRCPIISLPILREDEEKVKKEIQSLVDAVWSGRIVTELCAEPECEWCKLKNLTMS